MGRQHLRHRTLWRRLPEMNDERAHDGPHGAQSTGGSVDTALAWLWSRAVWWLLRLSNLLRATNPHMASRLYEWISNSRAFPGSIPAEQVRVTAALNHAILLGKSGDLTRGLSINDRVIKRFRESSDETLLSLVADAMVNKGYVLEQLDRASE